MNAGKMHIRVAQGLTTKVYFHENGERNSLRVEVTQEEVKPIIFRNWKRCDRYYPKKSEYKCVNVDKLRSEMIKAMCGTGFQATALKVIDEADFIPMKCERLVKETN